MIRMNIFIEVDIKNRLEILQVMATLVSESLKDNGRITYDALRYAPQRFDDL